MVYPCGWWERNVLSGMVGCRCASLDMLGYLLSDDAPIFTQDKFLMENVTELRIDYMHGNEVVKFVSKMHVDDGNGRRVETSYSDDNMESYTYLKSFGSQHFGR